MSACKYQKLLSPVKVGSLTLKNRIFCAPSSLNWINEDGSLSPEAIAFYEQAAMGGCAVVTYGEVIVHPTGKSHDRQLEINDPQRLLSMAQLARAIHRHGAYASAELSHGGKYGGLVSTAGTLKKDVVAYGASHEITPEGEVFEMPHDMVLEVIESFGEGAAVLKRAGFDMCMLHAGHGWLFSQFLSERLNHRTDEFGGSFENRARPLVMALESILRHCGRNFPIEVRISGDEYFEGGLTLEDAKQLVEYIQDKCDMINVSAGIHEGADLFIRTHPTSYLPLGPNVFLAEAIRKVAKIPISTVGGITDPALMEEILETGKADIIELRRPLIADPYLPKKLMTGKEDEIFRCLRCNNCFAESLKTNMLSCTINPIAGNERDAWIAMAQPVKEKKKVMIVGGGPGGLSAALAAANRGHDVVLYEKDPFLGGTLYRFQHIDFKYDLYRFVQTQERILRRRDNVTIHTGVEVTPAVVEQEKPDALFVAVGADPIVPRIPGIDGPNVRMAIDVFGKLDQFGEKIVVLGGGQVGCEAAAYCARAGKKVSVVEMMPDVCGDADIFDKAAVVGDLKKNGGEIYVCAKGMEINDKGLVIENKDGERQLIEADLVISAVGYKPHMATLEELAGTAPVIEVIGDCRKHGKVCNAVADGFYLAMSL